VNSRPLRNAWLGISLCEISGRALAKCVFWLEYHSAHAQMARSQRLPKSGTSLDTGIDLLSMYDFAWIDEFKLVVLQVR